MCHHLKVILSNKTETKMKMQKRERDQLERKIKETQVLLEASRTEG